MTDKSKTDSALAKGAELIHKAEAEKKAMELTNEEITDSKRPIEAILKDYVQVLDNHLGLEISDKIPLNESMAVLDWTEQLQDHVGFMIGDVLNFGEKKWGEKYDMALERTGRALPTLKMYSSVAARIPFQQRNDALAFTHYREIVKLGDPEKIEKAVKQLADQADDGELPTTREVADMVKKQLPKKERKAKTKKAPPEPYKFSSAERKDLDKAWDHTVSLITFLKVRRKLLVKITGKERDKWVKELQWLVDLQTDLQ